jgi:hypothetical protein
MSLNSLKWVYLVEILAASAFILGGCGIQPTTGEGISTPVPAITQTCSPFFLSDVSITGSAEGAPQRCSVEAVAGRLYDLSQAVDQADANLVPKFFGDSESGFQWFCLQDGLNPFTAYTLDELRVYLQGRYEKNERWKLERLQVNGYDAGRELTHFGPVVFTRTADDLESASQVLGKGAFSCVDETFVVLCLGEGAE